MRPGCYFQRLPALVVPGKSLADIGHYFWNCRISASRRVCVDSSQIYFRYRDREQRLGSGPGRIFNDSAALAVAAWSFFFPFIYVRGKRRGGGRSPIHVCSRGSREVPYRTGVVDGGTGRNLWFWHGKNKSGQRRAVRAGMAGRRIARASHDTPRDLEVESVEQGKPHAGQGNSVEEVQVGTRLLPGPDRVPVEALGVGTARWRPTRTPKAARGGNGTLRDEVARQREGRPCRTAPVSELLACTRIPEDVRSDSGRRRVRRHSHQLHDRRVGTAVWRPVPRRRDRRARGRQDLDDESRVVGGRLMGMKGRE